MLISTFLRRKGKRRQYCSSHQRVMKLILLAGLTLLLAHSSIRAIIVPNPVSQWSLILRYTNIIFSHISEFKMTWVIELCNFFYRGKRFTMRHVDTIMQSEIIQSVTMERESIKSVSKNQIRCSAMDTS